MYDRPPARARQAKRTVSASQPPETNETVGSAAPATAPKLYSPEWWTAERAREQRENERIKRAIQICHAC
jgi:hypothetical protein